MRAIIVAKRDDGKFFHAYGRKWLARIVNNERREGPLTTPFMVSEWIKGRDVDGMSLRPDLSFNTIAEMQERYPEIKIDFQ